MTQPCSKIGTGRHRIPQWQEVAAGGTGPDVPLSIWAGLTARGGAPGGLPCGGPVTVAAACRVIGTFSRPDGPAAAVGGSPAVITVAAAAGRAVLARVPEAPRSQQQPGGLDLAVTSVLHTRLARRGDCNRHVRCPL